MRRSVFLHYWLATTTTIIIIIISVLALLVGNLHCCHPEGAGGAGAAAGGPPVAAAPGAGGAPPPAPGQPVPQPAPAPPGGAQPVPQPAPAPPGGAQPVPQPAPAPGAGGAGAGAGAGAVAPVVNTLAPSTQVPTMPPGGAAPGATCGTACTSTSIATLTVPDATSAQLSTAIQVNTPTNTVALSAAGCTTLTPTCPAGQVVLVRVVTTAGTVFETYDSAAITFSCDAQAQWLSANGVRAGSTVNGYGCVVSSIAGGGAAGTPVTDSAAASAAAGQCSGCTAAALGRTTVEEAKLDKVKLFDAIGVSAGTAVVTANAQGCATLPLTCAPNEVVLVHIILANRDTDYGVYDSGAITLDCNSQNKWLVPLNAMQHQGLEVDRWSCVQSDLAAAAARAAAAG
ncbi:hypothetical protein niasHT_037704 [Heterodera trifolii]|uniref:Uncharacterized protein n=1 Tax=Heterodera trifolii TaxID=157864 RepID=A0ABD2J095_9BILA